jgi:hypothetical protein
MPIEFPCPTCHQQVRTPDAAAGKKGRCPNCGTVVIIPAPVTVVAPGPLSPGPFSVSPPALPPPSPHLPPPPPKLPLAVSAPTITADSIEFPCPQCQKPVRTPASMAGKRGQCPQCQAVVRIPGTKVSAPSPPAGKPPRDDVPTLTPLASQPPAGLLPQPPANPYAGLGMAGPAPHSVPGLVPLPPQSADALPTLLPLPTPLPTLASLPVDPLAGLPPANPLGAPALGPASAFNPYASPAATSYSQPAYQPRRIYDGDRRGLPWENEASMDTFGDTMSDVLGSPAEAFQRMRRGGGIANPMGYFIVGGVIGQIATAIYSTIIGAIVFATMGEGPFPFEALLILGAFELIGGIFGVVIAGVVLMFLVAAIYHVALLMVGGGQAGYEATYRALCFAGGSIYVLNAIPIVGPIIGFFYSFVVLIHAFTHTHEMGGGQAALAVFLPFLMFCCLCLTPAGFLSLGGLLSCWTLCSVGFSPCSVGFSPHAAFVG